MKDGINFGYHRGGCLDDTEQEYEDDRIHYHFMININKGEIHGKDNLIIMRAER